MTAQVVSLTEYRVNRLINQERKLLLQQFLADREWFRINGHMDVVADIDRFIVTLTEETGPHSAA